MPKQDHDRKLKYGERSFEFNVLLRLEVLEDKLDRILERLSRIATQERKIMATLEALTTQVKANTDVEASAILLLEGLAAQITALKNDPVALQALADQLKASETALAAAIVANTPVVEPPVQ